MSGPWPSAVLDPARVEHVPEPVILEMLREVEAALPEEAFVEIGHRPGSRAWIVGDTHGDWPTSQFLAARALQGGTRDGLLVALGDYVDRTPRELPQGSVRNALFLVSLLRAFPRRVVLLRGNHEAVDQIPAGEPSVPAEASEIWGPRTRVGTRLLAVLERLPIAATMPNGIFLAHGGILRGTLEGSWKEVLRHPEVSTLWEILWNDLEGSPAAGNRGIPIPPFREKDLEDFLGATGLTGFVRGHDPGIAGRFLCHDRLLTVHSTRAIRSGGFWTASVALDEPLADLRGVSLERFDPPRVPRHPRAAGNGGISPEDPVTEK